MNRRGFLGLIGTALAGAALDPDELVWKPGKLISIPKVIIPLITLTLGDIFTIEGFYEVNPLTGKPTSLLQQYVVTKDYTSSKNLEFNHFWPPVIDRGQFFNIAKAPIKGIRRITPVLRGKCVWSQSVPLA